MNPAPTARSLVALGRSIGDRVRILATVFSLLILCLTFTSCGGGSSSNSPAQNPTPTTTGISPSSLVVGSSSQTLTINGSGFIASSSASFNGASQTTTFVAANQLTMTLTNAELSTAGNFNVVVTNPAPGGGTSNSEVFAVDNPVPAITSVSPNAASVGSAGQTLTLNGSGFVSSSVANLNGASRTTSFVNATQLTVEITASDELNPGTVNITASNPGPGGGTSNSVTFAVLAPITVQLSVAASDPAGNPLSYRWKATDGTIVDTNSSSTTWTLPGGPGLHFAYVLVSNGKGGYTERRVAVNTDSIGTPAAIFGPQTLAAPPAASQSGDFFRSYVQRIPASLSGDTPVGYIVDVPVFVTNNTTGKRYPPLNNVLTDFRGEYVVPGLPSGAYSVHCSFDEGATFADCTPLFPAGPSAVPPSIPDPLEALSFGIGFIFYESVGTPSVVKPNTYVLMSANATDNPCGTVNEFFGVHSTGSASLLNSVGGTLGTVRGSELGLYSFPYNAAASSVQVTCEGLAPINLPFTPQLNGTIVYATASGIVGPTVSGMTATLNGNSVGTFLLPPSGLPSDLVIPKEVFLGAKGVDSQLGACLYYKAIGAVQGCDAAGNPSGAISFDDWKRAVKIGPYATPGTTEYAATYVNKVDLNLTRNHHSISYGPNQTAAYVCNHLGPPFALVNAQSDIDTVVANAVNGRNLVACVAMDWGITQGVNGDAPFTRFLIFGPSGQLLLSINLDGRAEKYVPGTCVVCHGGDHYAGKFPEDGTGVANVGGHFLPYDIGNFLFSSATGLRQVDQEAAIYHLNQNVLNAGPTQAEIDLIGGWYQTSQVQNQSYLPPTWMSLQQVPGAISFYQNVEARSCRTCHVALSPTRLNFDNFGILDGAVVYAPVCYKPWWVYDFHSMPNSLVTHNRFWLSKGNTVGVPDQVAIWNAFVGTMAPNAPCQ